MTSLISRSYGFTFFILEPIKNKVDCLSYERVDDLNEVVEKAF